MIYRRRRVRGGLTSGFYRFDNRSRSVMGFGDGDFISLHDDSGREWRGTAERQSDNTVRYRFRDNEGNVVAGISDRFGITLRDDKGNTWRGFVD
jgi:hypothetical protein